MVRTDGIDGKIGNDVLHTVALDWLSKPEFNRAAAKAALLLANNRAEYERHYAAVRAAFAQARASQNAEP